MRDRVTILLSLVFLLVLCGVVYYLPPVHDRLSWRLEELVIVIKSKLSPPENVELLPGGSSLAPVEMTVFPKVTATHLFTITPTSTQLSETPPPPATATLSPTPLPAKVALKGVRYEDQHGLWNYCAPANLSMALSYWGWKGDRLDTGKVLKPYDRDKNVMPYEMVDFVTTQTSLKAVSRVGGDLDLVRDFVVNGFPVLVEKGAWIRDFTKVVSWMGHYEVVTGYDDSRQVIIAQDSYFTPDFEVTYEDFINGWRSFNYTYIVIYPPDKEQQVMEILGEDANEVDNFNRAARIASDEIFALTGTDQFFAWYNRGTNLEELQDYGGAAAAFDEAFSIYNQLPEDRSVRPYRILWYQTGPYFAYFYVGRYYDVISLATTAIEAALDEPAIEESFYWRGMARNALGDDAGAKSDFLECLKYHPDFEPAVYQLNLLGVTP
jgi:hypothetical protein